MSMIHVFTEEPSAKNVFDEILPKLLPQGFSFRVYPHQGKQDLKRALQNTIPTISKIPGSRILITRDQDAANCVEVKDDILATLNNKCSCPFFVRIVCKELESWFLGDLDAVNKAYPRFKPSNYSGRADLRHVDKIVSPNKFLLRIIPEYSKRETLPKLEASSKIAPYLDIGNNKSESFNQTVNAIRQLTGNTAASN
jgi:Domain of unknown function (DUF4276)